MHITYDMMDPELRLFNRYFKKQFVPGQTVEYIREQGKKALASPRPQEFHIRGLRIEKRSIPRQDGSSMPILMVTRQKSAGVNRPGILNLHSGGYSGGVPEQDLNTAKIILSLTDGVWISPEYRLSIEAPYPAAVEDSYLCLKWMKEHAAELGIRTDQLVVMGGSAGGGLAAATSEMCVETGEIRIAFQMVLYPMLDDRETPSSRDNDSLMYDGFTNQSNWKVYLGDLYGTDAVPATAAPARASDFSRLPPTIAMVGGIEPFRDETVTYVNNLRAAGVPVEFQEFPGVWHGFELFAGWTRIARRANRWKYGQFQKFLGLYFAKQPEDMRTESENR